MKYSCCIQLVPNRFITMDHLLCGNITVALERGHKRFKSPSKLDGVNVFTSVLSSFTKIHMTSSINSSCKAWYKLIHGLVPVRGLVVGEHCCMLFRNFFVYELAQKFH